MKNLVTTLVIGVGILGAIPISAQTFTQVFHSRVRGKSLETRMTEDMLKMDLPPSLYKNEGGKLVWAVTATVSLEEARDVAVAEAKRLVGADYDKNWAITRAARMVSAYEREGRYLHHYCFHFNERKRFGGDSLNIVVLLDGTLLPLIPR